MNDGICADYHLVVDRRVRIDAHARREYDIAPDDSTCADPRALVNLRRRIDHGRRMDERLERWFGMKETQGARVSEIRIARAQDGDLAPGGDACGQIDR